MAIMYSEKFRLELNKLNDNLIGVRLAKLCVKADVPPIEVAEKCEVSRLTVYTWFRGGAIRNRNLEKIKILIKELEKKVVQ
jgi:DNA invertase Pin-like site-specific DNA recombinase